MACREIDLIVVHCSVTCADHCFTEHDLEAAHRHRGFNGCGYHFHIRGNRDIKTIRSVGRIGAYTRGYSVCSIGICCEGGLDEKGRPADTRTGWQCHSLRVLVHTLLLGYPGCRICGRRDLSPDLGRNGEVELEEWIKQCPYFKVSREQ